MKMIHMNVCNGEIRYLKLVPYDEQVFDNAKRSGYTEGIYNPKGIEYIVDCFGVANDKCAAVIAKTDCITDALMLLWSVFGEGLLNL